MKKNNKFIVMVMLCLACFTMISIGFATWTISLNKTSKEEIKGTIDTDEVINSDDYVTMEIDSSRMFRYCRYGFVDKMDTSKVVKDGVLPLNITIHNLTTFKNKFKNENFDSIILAISLSYDNSKVNGGNAFKLFTTTNDYKFSKKIIENDNEPYRIDFETSGKVTTTFTTNECMITLKLDNLISGERDSYSFKIDYIFSVIASDMKNYFTNNIFQTINRKNLFGLTCKISGYKVNNGEQ